jgi:hypothetical protein
VERGVAIVSLQTSSDRVQRGDDLVEQERIARGAIAPAEVSVVAAGEDASPAGVEGWIGRHVAALYHPAATARVPSLG